MTVDGTTVDTLGFVQRFGADSIVCPYGKRSIAAIAGHWLYVLKCRPARRHLDTPDGEVELFHPGKGEDLCNWAEVVAIGTRVGESRSPHEKARLRKKGVRRRELPGRLAEAFAVGDIVLIPDEHRWGLMHSPESEHEFLVDEAVVICKDEERAA